MDIATDGIVLVLVGDFDGRSTWRARTAIYEHLAATEETVVVIDLAGVRSADLPALKVLAVASLVAGRQGRHLVLRGCCPAVRRMLHRSRLIRLVDLERAPVSA